MPLSLSYDPKRQGRFFGLKKTQQFSECDYTISRGFKDWQSSPWNSLVVSINLLSYWDRINSVHLSDISGPCRKKTYSTSPDEEHALEFPGAGGSHDEDNGETRPSSGKIGCNKVSKNVHI